MIVPLLIFIAVGLTSYAGFLKLAARLLRYSVPWKVSFLFAGIIMVAVIFHHVVLFSAPVALRIGLGMVLLLGLVISGWLVFQRTRYKPPRFMSWVVWRDSAHGAGLCNDDCGGVRDRYADPIFPGQTPFAVAMTFFCNLYNGNSRLFVSE
jgi:hypothetical protein